MVFVTYCSADVHTGTRDVTFTDSLGFQSSLHFQGYVNSQSALQWTYANSPDRSSISSPAAVRAR